MQKREGQDALQFRISIAEGEKGSDGRYSLKITISPAGSYHQRSNALAALGRQGENLVNRLQLSQGVTFKPDPAITGQRSLINTPLVFILESALPQDGDLTQQAIETALANIIDNSKKR